LPEKRSAELEKNNEQINFVTIITVSPNYNHGALQFILKIKKMNSKNKTIVTNFIEEIWNQQNFNNIENYISPYFIDHSLPPTLPADKNGMKLWIIGTGKSFEHKTIIDDIVCEEDKVMLKIRMQLKHIGTWRDLEPTYLEISTVGYRYYRLSKEKIVEHWSLLDGNSIENQLKNAQHGCKIQE
jgi:predicted SnoaL-like aldol condensation-catalyzing enzyme